MNQTQKIEEVGYLVKIKNINKRKFSNEKDEYLFVTVIDTDKVNTKNLIFTEREIRLAESRTRRLDKNKQ